MTFRSTRRDFGRYSGLSLLGAAASGWLPSMAARAAEQKKNNAKKCILLWMSGGPSQMETFDPKPGAENGGPTKSIETSVPGVQISEHLPQVAKVMQHLAPNSLHVDKGRRPYARHLFSAHRISASGTDSISNRRLVPGQRTHRHQVRPADVCQRQSISRICSGRIQPRISGPVMVATGCEFQHAGNR